MPLKSNCNHIVFIMEGKQKKNTFRFENTSLRFTIVEHIVLRIIQNNLLCSEKLSPKIRYSILQYPRVLPSAHTW